MIWFRLKETSDAIYCCFKEGRGPLTNETTCCNDPNRSIFDSFTIPDGEEVKHDFYSITGIILTMVLWSPKYPLIEPVLAMVYLILVGLLMSVDLISFLFRGNGPISKKQLKRTNMFVRRDSAEKSECHFNTCISTLK